MKIVTPYDFPLRWVFETESFFHYLNSHRIRFDYSPCDTRGWPTLHANLGKWRLSRYFGAIITDENVEEALKWKYDQFLKLDDMARELIRGVDYIECPNCRTGVL